MRSYPRNSAEAAARIVAVVLMADGNVCRHEITALERAGASQALGLPPEGIARVLQALCEDLLQGLCTTGSMLAHLDDDTLASLMHEVDDPRLQQEVLRIARAVAAADDCLTQGEQTVLDAARRHWPAAAAKVAAEVASQPA